MTPDEIWRAYREAMKEAHYQANGSAEYAFDVLPEELQLYLIFHLDEMNWFKKECTIQHMMYLLNKSGWVSEDTGVYGFGEDGING